MAEYAYETRASLDDEIRRLEERAREARVEADYAKHQPGLIGPQRNAEADAQRLEAEASELREVGLRVDRGFEYWERNGFEDAVDACGDYWRWLPLAELLTADRVYGHDGIDIRLPVPVQQSYVRAVESGLFSSFEVCQTFDTDREYVVATRNYLFATQHFSHVGTCLFFVDRWDS